MVSLKSFVLLALILVVTVEVESLFFPVHFSRNFRTKLSLLRIQHKMSQSGKNVNSKTNKLYNYLKTEGGSADAETVTTAIDTIAKSVDSITGNDATAIITGTLDIISAVTSLIPKHGPIVSTAFSLLSTVLGTIGGGQEDVGSIVRKEITRALNNYDDSQLRAEASGTARIYRNSQLYLSAAEKSEHSLKEHELASLSANIPIYHGVKFLGILASKIKENSQSADVKQAKRAIDYTRLYVELAVLRSAVLWRMYALVKTANHSGNTADGIRGYITADEREDVHNMKFLASPEYSRAVFFAYLYPSKLPEVAKFLEKSNLSFQKLQLGKGTHTLRPQKWKKWFMIMSSGRSMRGSRRPGLFYFDAISSDDNLFYIRSRRWSNRYVYMRNDQWGNCRGWNGKPGSQGHWKVVRFSDGNYMLSPERWPNWFIYMKNNAIGSIRGWEGDPGIQGHWLID